MRHLLKPIQMNNSWSSKQRLNPEDLASLRKDLLALSIRLQKKACNTTGIMTNTTYADLTLITTIRNMQKSILINQGNG